MITHNELLVNNAEWPIISTSKKDIEDEALLELEVQYETEEIHDKICDLTRDRDCNVADIMRDDYHAKILKVEPLIYDDGDDSRFVVAYDIEWDGFEEEEG